MAEVAPEKSSGLKFAEQQLLRHGWEHGKGLGRAENGISEAIKVKVKCDKGGVGHREGEQFTFHWWDHVFNKASSSLQVASDQDGIKLKKTEEEEEEEGGPVSNKRPRKAALARDKLYGCFVKSATLLSGREQPETPASQSDEDEEDSSSEEDEERRLDLSSTTKLSDQELMKVCGGRTAHKGARHGLTMSAKLARLEQQEAEFMAKYGKKNQSGSGSPASDTTGPPASREEATEEEEQRCSLKKKKKKKSAVDAEDAAESPETLQQPKKKKKKKRERDDAAPKKQKKSKADEEAEPPESEAQPQRKKKKKLSPQSSEPEEEEEEEEEQVKTKRKKCKKDKTPTQE